MKLKFIFLILLLNLTFKAQNLIPFYDKGKYGLSDTEGKIILEPIYSETRFFSDKTNGYAVKKDGKYGLLNKDLKVVIPFISLEPIIATETGYIVYFSEKELHYYSKNYQFVKKRIVDQTPNSYGPIVAENYDNLNISNEKVLELFKKKYPKKGKYQVVSANSTYYDICEKNESGKCKSLAIFLPKASVFLINDEAHNYRSASWNPATSKYYILVESGKKKYVIDQDQKTIFPEKEYETLYVMKYYIGYKDKNSNSKKSTTHYFIINSGVVIENKFSSFDHVKSLMVNGKNFDIFKVSINNYDLHKSENVYIGENGKQYFNVDFEFDN